MSMIAKVRRRDMPKIERVMNEVSRNYLKAKRELFFSTAKILQRAKILEESLVWLRNDTEIVYDLLGLYFEDKSGYQRAWGYQMPLFIPLPLVMKSKKRIARRLMSLVCEGDIQVVSKDWHDLNIRGRPMGYYPPVVEMESDEYEEEF